MDIEEGNNNDDNEEKKGIREEYNDMNRIMMHVLQHVQLQTI